MNVYKPFVLATYAAGQYNKYVNYDVVTMYKKWSNGQEVYDCADIYSGRTWCDASGNTTINLTNVLKDFAFSPIVEYNGNLQRWEIQQRTIADLTPIEADKVFYNNELGIVINNDMRRYEVETTKPTINNPVYDIPLNPYTNDTGVIFYDSIGTDIIPEIPYVLSDNCYFGFSFGIDKRYKTDTLVFGNAAALGSTITKQLNNEWGNYFIIDRLSQIYSVLPSNLNGIFLNIQPDPEAEAHPLPRTTQLCKINKCDYDYYLQWFTVWGGWQSQGFKGRYIDCSNTLKKETITNLSNQQKIINTESEFKYTLSRTCGKDLYNLLSTLKMSPWVWLYDTKNDIGKPVIITDTTVNEGGAVNTITMELTDVQKYNF